MEGARTAGFAGDITPHEIVNRRNGSDPIDDASSSTMVEIDQTESLRLLASARYGRVVFTRDALPAIRPANHLFDGGMILIRTRLLAQLSSTPRTAPGVVVAYQADDIDPVGRMGWSVVVTGFARPVTDPQLIARCERLLAPWGDPAPTFVIGIEPTIVKGVRLTEIPR
ncbi:pyridoxamine 5'-phosphate oxidase family protein [Nocardia abscessus]|uniref:pyridoxamine 5'-phosphate oxidase family protein n=1 Tax=Nocardia abscessus TaxID=120957 RepID=UPI003CC7FE1F